MEANNHEFQNWNKNLISSFEKSEHIRNLEPTQFAQHLTDLVETCLEKDVPKDSWISFKKNTDGACVVTYTTDTYKTGDLDYYVFSTNGDQLLFGEQMLSGRSRGSDSSSLIETTGLSDFPSDNKSRRLLERAMRQLQIKLLEKESGKSFHDLEPKEAVASIVKLIKEKPTAMSNFYYSPWQRSEFPRATEILKDIGLLTRKAAIRAKLPVKPKSMELKYGLQLNLPDGGGIELHVAE